MVAICPHRILRTALIFAASSGLCAQSLSISPSSAKRGESGSFLVTASWPAGKAPAALQWTFRFPVEVSVNPDDILTGSAAASAQKSLACAPISPSPKAIEKGSAYGCILSGGRNTLPNGPLAVVRYHVAGAVGAAEGKVRIEKAMAVSPDLQKSDLAVAEGLISIK
jgi:hypothetical protein